jgi:hypothetical protein
MLRPGLFAGPETKLVQAAGRFWNDFSRAITTRRAVIDVDGALDEVTKRRLIEFLDTRKKHLGKNHYIFRVRRDGQGPPEVTLKYRHGDRYLAQSRRMNRRRLDVDSKFEEDVKGPFVSLYSYSASGELEDGQVPSDLGAVARLFPDIERRFDAFEPDQRLVAIGFTARELVLTGATFRIGRRSKVRAECALIVWYEDKGAAEAPVAVEFSFRYGNKNERYPGRATRRALEAFETLLALDKWVDPHPRTKTALMYS